ncbi:HVA22-like protein k [Pistacia vera]|uniref:HVA22-like protein k n=1 Tax=Pistacia vera TaxID=55513 RepID=UPI001262E070|nr:HVA22-like protein k [Pistacia vera]
MDVLGLGSTLTKEVTFRFLILPLRCKISLIVGLRLLLCPFGSNVVIRTACCSVGIVLPVYSTFKAIERKDQDDQQKWLIYWAAYGSFSIVEVFSDKLLFWFPMYYHLKFAFLVWLQLPSAEGATKLYRNHLRPFLLRHQARIDQLVGFAYHQMARIFSSHQAEFQFAKTVLMKIIGTAGLIFRGTGQQGHNEIEGPPSPISDTQSDHED